MRNPIAIPLPVRGVVTADPEKIPADGAREMENWIYLNGEFRVRPGLVQLGDLINPATSINSVVLTAPDGSRWLVEITNLGIFTQTSTTDAATAAIIVAAPDGGLWQLGITNIGTLTMTSTAIAATATTIFQSPDGGQWELGVTNSGAPTATITTYGPQRPTGFTAYDDVDGNRRLIVATTKAWWVYDEATSTWQVITDSTDLLTGGTEQQVFRIFQQSSKTWLLGTNWKDSPKKWDTNPLNNFQAIGGSPPVSRCMMVLADRVLFGNLKSGGTISPVGIVVSNRLDFDSGYATVLVLLLPNAVDIIAMEEMSELIGAVHCADSIWLAIAQGGAEPFRFEPKVHYKEGQGPASTQSVIRTGSGRQVVLGANGHVNYFDGATWGEMWPEASAYIRRTANPVSFNRAWAAYDSVNELALFVYPEAGNNEPNLGVIVDERTGAPFPVRWTGKYMTAGTFAKSGTGLRIADLPLIGDISQTLGELGSFSRRLVLGESGSKIYEFVGEDDDGTGIPFFAETGLQSLGNGSRWKTAKRIEYRFSQAPAAQTVTAKLGTSKHGEDRVLGSGQDIDIGAVGPYKTGHRKTSKFFSVRLEGTATQPIIWRGSYAEYANRGHR